MHIIMMLMKCFSKTLQCNTGVLQGSRLGLASCAAVGLRHCLGYSRPRARPIPA